MPMDLESRGGAVIERLLKGELDAVIFEFGNAYVQFAGTRAEVRCEASGAKNFGRDLSFEQLQALSRLHFFPPAPGSSGNHWQSARDADSSTLARLAVETLTTVFAADPERVMIQEV